MKYFQKQGYWNNPYNLGVSRNLIYTFGQPGTAYCNWILPFPLQLLKNDPNWPYKEPWDILGVTYYPLSPYIIKNE